MFQTTASQPLKKYGLQNYYCLLEAAVHTAATQVQ